ncbi:hypothetical protein [Lentzea flaviverrucosa]|uniref:Uncharacterized protein n=1 Tax=Lentzea flaviverrucosa TaxID=200379 RepID=A0A1H9FU09_9PSEU|nr:hypothetical protein [Lentzea flaviverrucosa]RDI35102.1 hypothetical protein DFR72_101852 [Lentzea flaviverrucosa]SEQ41450.1 hypothetical protein SAMN05216195_102365 [Lentzea flaviverrucosa]
MRGLTAVLLCLVLASCGQVPPPQVPASSTPTTDTSTPSIPAPLPPSSVPLPTTPPLLPTPSRALDPGVTTVRGTVSGGVESGCTLLNTGGEQYLLLGADPAIAVAGAVVEVSGRADPGGMTTCQQGTPFHVIRTQRG